MLHAQLSDKKEGVKCAVKIAWTPYERCGGRLNFNSLINKGKKRGRDGIS